ncbi:hypothetical protein DY245_27900 [Streptomyces inhibens]|uniref:Uncharacterized protein n=1 Tax=Streptomyces inhibens TaxID=2293571 RepID=A0A371PXN2_STRIH|nr:hypothetical protein [Streptomyces inhibens]REK87218.1 hypothetical protein DY245_27900 [Streptomyces inhibens]
MSETADCDTVSWGDDGTAAADAVCHVEDGYWFFSGDMPLKYPNSGDSLIVPPAQISYVWPSLSW